MSKFFYESFVITCCLYLRGCFYVFDLTRVTFFSSCGKHVLIAYYHSISFLLYYLSCLRFAIVSSLSNPT